MTIATVDALIAGFQPPRSYGKVLTGTLIAGQPRSLWYLAGYPGAGSAAANTAGGVNLSSSSSQVAGQIQHVDPGGGISSYLARFVGQATIAGTLLLCDRLQQICGNSGGTAISVTATTSQTITGGALPSRDDAGSTNGAGVLCALECAANMGAGAGQTLTLGYTDQDGNASASAANIDTIAASSLQGTFIRFGLAAGDTGIRSVQTYQSSGTFTTGTLSLVLYRILASLELPAALVPNALDELTSAMPQIYNGCVPFLVFLPSTTTSSQISAHYIEAQG